MLGRTTLDFCPCVSLDSRMGWFEPTELGERLMPALTSLGAYHEEISREIAEGSLPSGEPIDAPRRSALAREALDYKVTQEAGVALRNLELELHDADGNIVRTESIAMQDTEYLIALGGADDDVIDEQLDALDDVDETDEFDSALIELGVEEDLTIPDDWANADASDEAGWDDSKSTLPRYQIFVDLVDGKSLPVPDRWKDDPYVQSLVAGFDPFADGDEGD